MDTLVVKMSVNAFTFDYTLTTAAEVERVVDGVVGHSLQAGDVDLQVVQQVVLVGDLKLVVFGVPGDVTAAAAGGVVIILGQQILGHGREQHKEAGDADVVERVVAGLVGSLVLRVLNGSILDILYTEVFSLDHPGNIVLLGGPAATRRVDVDLGDAVAGQVQPKVVDKPGGTAIPPGSVDQPPCHTQAAF